MKNLKKIALLLSILTVFAISCKSSQDALNSTFDVITDDPTSVPDNPPEQISKPENTPFPENFVFKTTDLYFEPSSSWNTYLTVHVDKGSLNGKSLKYRTQSSFESRTAGVSDPKGVLSALGTIEDRGVAGQLQIPINGSLYGAMGSAGQRAKVKYDVYIDVNVSEGENQYNTGVRTIYIEMYKRYSI